MIEWISSELFRHGERECFGRNTDEIGEKAPRVPRAQRNRERLECSDTEQPSAHPPLPASIRASSCTRLARVKVRAIAITTARTNVIGSVELTTSAEGLYVVYVDAAQLGGDGVPIAFAPMTEVVVPWNQVQDARVLGHAILLELEVAPKIFHRLILVRFSFGDDKSLHEIRQRRLMLRAFAVAAGIMAIAVSAFVMPRISPHLGPYFGLVLGVLLAAGITAVGLAIDRFITTGGRPSSLVREIFIGELLATLPRLPREPASNLTPTTPLRLPNLDGLLPRTTVAVTITMAGALLAALVMGKWVLWGNHTQAREAPRRYVQAPTPQQRPELTQPNAYAESPEPTPPSASIAASVSAATAIASATPLIPGAFVNRGPCTCTRADSPLWREPLPKLTPLVLATRRFPHKNHEDIELELAVVNNSERPLGNISVLVEFFEADQSNATRLTSVESKTVFFEGPLGAGKAIKWHVEERGTTFKIHTPTSNGIVIDESIGNLGEGAAAAGAFVELLRANNRPVRLHAAMMLAYLGDRRARSGVVELGEALRDSEAGYLRRLLEATADQVACQIEIAPSGDPRTLRACIFNAGAAPLVNPNAILHLLDAAISPKDPVAPPPQIVTERSLPLPITIAPKSGVLVEGSVEWNDMPQRPASYELLIGAAR